MKKLDKQQVDWLEQLLDSSHIGILSVDKNHKNIMVNEHICRLFGYSQDELVGASAEIFHESNESFMKFGKLASEAISDGKTLSLNYQFMKKDKTLFWVHISANPVQKSGDVLWTLVDITNEIGLKNKLMEQESMLQHKATHDELTALPSRLLYNDRLQEAMKIAKRNQLSMATLLVNLDDFKDINDTYGNEAGDELLRVVAQRVREVVRDEDSVARLGGDEFGVILSHIFDADDTAKIAEKIINSVSMPTRYKNDELKATCSIGIALYPQHGSDLDELSKNSDNAMIEAKNSGKSTYKFFSIDKDDILLNTKQKEK